MDAARVNQGVVGCTESGMFELIDAGRLRGSSILGFHVFEKLLQARDCNSAFAGMQHGRSMVLLVFDSISGGVCTRSKTTPQR